MEWITSIHRIYFLRVEKLLCKTEWNTIKANMVKGTQYQNAIEQFDHKNHSNRETAPINNNIIVSKRESAKQCNEISFQLVLEFYLSESSAGILHMICYNALPSLSSVGTHIQPKDQKWPKVNEAKTLSVRVHVVLYCHWWLSATSSRLGNPNYIVKHKTHTKFWTFYTCNENLLP